MGKMRFYDLAFVSPLSRDCGGGNDPICPVCVKPIGKKDREVIALGKGSVTPTR